jgi:copper chaperone NosL
MNRRGFLQSLALTPVAAAVLAGCGQADDGFADGMLPIKWDRDNCVRCGMAIGDRRFASELRGGPKNEAFKFDDIGCATTWCSEKVSIHPWLNDPATRWWVAAFDGNGRHWLPARQAHYADASARSPMGYNRAAYAQALAGSVPFETMAEQTAAAWPANCRPGQATALTDKT